MSPLTVIGLAVPVARRAPLVAVHVAVYAVMAEPPVDDGAVNDTRAEPSPAVADTPVGALGTVRVGVMAGLSVELLEQAAPHKAVQASRTERRMGGGVPGAM